MTRREYIDCFLNDVPAALRGCVLTIGNFDGVHLGHQRILSAVRELGDSTGAAVVVLTLEPPPAGPAPEEGQGSPGAGKGSLDAAGGKRFPPRITPAEVKRALLRQAGADCVVTTVAEKSFLALSPGEFLREVVLARFAPRHVVEGPDFVFGRGRSGGLDLLRRAGGEHGFEIHVVEPVYRHRHGAPGQAAAKPQRISSTLIRSMVAAGDVEGAAECLGRPFALYGPVVHGEGRGGRLLDFPTANVAPSGQAVPADGVYAGEAVTGSEKRPAAISVGANPTFGRGQRTVEAFLIGATGDYYGRDMALHFRYRLRSQERFAGPAALKEQIARDVERVRSLIGKV
jgi:riboflavin kinase / FMN adenylyltransferase